MLDPDQIENADVLVVRPLGRILSHRGTGPDRVVGAGERGASAGERGREGKAPAR